MELAVNSEHLTSCNAILIENFRWDCSTTDLAKYI